MNNSLQLHTITYANVSKMYIDLHTYHNIVTGKHDMMIHYSSHSSPPSRNQ